MELSPVRLLPDWDPIERLRNRVNADAVQQQVVDMLVIPKQAVSSTPTPPPTPTVIVYPFDAEFSAGSDSLHNTVTIRPGTLSGLIPSNIATTYNLLISGTFYLTLSAVSAAGVITSCSLSCPTSAPSGIGVSMGLPPLGFDYLLGIISGGVFYRTINPGSLVAVCAEVYRVDKAAPAPGTLPYDIYYTWNLQAA